MSNIITLPGQHTVQTMNILRQHIAKLRKTNVKGSNDEAIALNEGALRSFISDAISGPEADSQKLAA